MTREEAIKGLKVLAKDFSGYKPNEEMFDMAIKALEQPECEDAVSRFKVLRLIDYSSHDLNDSVDNRYMQNEIKQLPSVTPKQPGWIPCTPETMPEREGRYVCTYTYDGKKDVFMFRFEDGDFLVPWYVDAITAWYKPLDPWEGEQDEQN